MKTYFDHEKLDVYREAILFCGWVGEVLATITARAAVKDQLDRASTSIPLNIAEGNGKFSGHADLLKEGEASYLAQVEHEHEHDYEKEKDE